MSSKLTYKIISLLLALLFTSNVYSLSREEKFKVSLDLLEKFKRGEVEKEKLIKAVNDYSRFYLKDVSINEFGNVVWKYSNLVFSFAYTEGHMDQC